MNKIIYFLFLVAVLASCAKERPASWATSIPKAGTNSSPRLVDLNQDDILDVVIGAGYNENEPTEEGVLAFDGKDGRLLWKVAASDQIVGSAVFLDITQDQIPDVFIGGRGANFFAINGQSGDLIWAYQKPDSKAEGALKYARFNFYNAQIVPDQNEDGVADLLVSNGGNYAASAGEDRYRYPGVLMLLDSQTGQVIAVDSMPDGGETYFSPLLADQYPTDETSLYFGTGGETFGGKLYRTQLKQLKKGQLHTATVLLEDQQQGFVAPPVLVDVTGDKVLDLILNSHAGVMYALDGRTDSLLWKLEMKGTEANSSLACGYFNDDKIPDFFGHFSQGVWPENRGNYQVFVDGRDGRILYKDSLGCIGFFSPVAFDFDQDGRDEVLISVNDYNCFGIDVIGIQHQLYLFDLQDRQAKPFGRRYEMKNISSTPWIGDMDADDQLDVVYAVQSNTTSILEFYGMAVIRKDTTIQVLKQPAWGTYMGSAYNGIFENRSFQ